MFRPFCKIALIIITQQTFFMCNIPKQIVLVGGGYASVWAYRSIIDELLIEMMAGQVEIKVICPDEFHVFHGWSAECLAGIIGDQNRLSRLTELFKYAEVIKGEAVNIDPESKMIDVALTTGVKRLVSYDQVLVATGSADSSSVAGIGRHAFRLKSEEDYRATKLQIKYLLEKAAVPNRLKTKKTIRFVIAGCGFTGLEVASNLAELIRVFKRQYAALQNADIFICLINSRKNLLPDLPSKFRHIRKYSEKTLSQYGIETINQTKITRVTDQGVFLSDGKFLESEMVISTIGQVRTMIPGMENLDRDSENKIITNSFLQTIKYPDIWVAGDSSNTRSLGIRNTCPSNALWAIKQGEHAGRNMARVIVGRSLKPFAYRGLGQCASLGIGKGVGELYGMQFTGWLAWIMRWIFFQHFMPSKKTMWREVKDWLIFCSSGKRKYIRLNVGEKDRIFHTEHRRTKELNNMPFLASIIRV
jgi:NADH:ubiquinone reductase (H+-translocating)